MALTDMQVTTYAANINNGVTLNMIDQFSASDLQQIGALYSENIRNGVDFATCSQLQTAQAAGIPVDSDIMYSVCSAYANQQNQANSNTSATVPAAITTDSTIPFAPLSTADVAASIGNVVDPGDLSTSNNPSDIVVNTKAITTNYPQSTSSFGVLASVSGSSNNEIVVVASKVSDRRARLSPRPAVFDQLISNTGLLAPLRATYGLMFPITPQIAENIDVGYETFDITHSNQPFLAFKSGGQKTLTISAMFVAQTDIEARYCLACIHFLRSFSKMNFGDNDPNAGTPPPILMFNAYGDAMYSNVPVVISTANFTWPNDVDYVYTSANSKSTNSAYSPSDMVADGWVPSKFSVDITLSVQRTPSQARAFNLNDFREGTLVKKGWI